MVAGIRLVRYRLQVVCPVVWQYAGSDVRCMVPDSFDNRVEGMQLIHIHFTPAELSQMTVQIAFCSVGNCLFLRYLVAETIRRGGAYISQRPCVLRSCRQNALFLKPSDYVFGNITLLQPRSGSPGKMLYWIDQKRTEEPPLFTTA